VKGYPFEVPLPNGLPTAGAVRADQVKSIDRHARRIEVAGQVPKQVVAAVQERIRALLEG
jgi:mRNA interferase MazF